VLRVLLAAQLEVEPQVELLQELRERRVQRVELLEAAGHRCLHQLYSLPYPQLSFLSKERQLYHLTLL
jgi:hypothetical protein